MMIKWAHPRFSLIYVITGLLLSMMPAGVLASEAFERARAKIEARFPDTTFFDSRDKAKEECGSGNYLDKDVTIDDGAARYWFYYCGKMVDVEFVPSSRSPLQTLDDSKQIEQSAREAFQPQDSAGGGIELKRAYQDALSKLLVPIAPSPSAMQTQYTGEPNPFVSSETSQSKEASKECRANTAAAINEIDSRIGELHQSMSAWGEGPQVDVGSCASRLRKLEGNFLCCKTFANYAATWEEISCLSLKKFYLRKSCACQGGSYSTNEALQDSVLERYAAVKLMRSEALKKGIKNPLIRQYVKDASTAVDCITDSSLAKLNKIEADLGYVLSLE